MTSRRGRTHGLALLLLAAGCGDSSSGGVTDTARSDTSADATVTDSATDGDTTAPSLVIGVSWPNSEGRWANADEPAIRAVIAAAGATYISTDAGDSDAQQMADIGHLVAQGAKVILVIATDSESIKPAIAQALAAGVQVIAYDRLIDDPGLFFLTFDNLEVGRMEAREVLKQAPEGNYVIIKGDQRDGNSDLFRAGQQEILAPAIASGAVKIVGEAYTDSWDPAVAEDNMVQFLVGNDNQVDAVVAANDGTAGGVIAALDAQGLAGKVPVSGQDCEPDALNRVALGTQTVSVWKDVRKLAAKAGEVAVALAGGTHLADIAGSSLFETPGGNSMHSFFVAPIPITRDNLQVVVDAGWITQEDLCQGVPAGSVPACP